MSLTYLEKDRTTSEMTIKMARATVYPLQSNFWGGIEFPPLRFDRSNID